MVRLGQCAEREKTRPRALRARLDQNSIPQYKKRFFTFCGNHNKKFLFRVKKKFSPAGGDSVRAGLERPVERREWCRSIPFTLLYRLVHFQLDLSPFGHVAETVLMAPNFREKIFHKFPKSEKTKHLKNMAGHSMTATSTSKHVKITCFTVH